MQVSVWLRSCWTRAYGGLPILGVPCWGVPVIKTSDSNSISGSILGSRILGNYHLSLGHAHLQCNVEAALQSLPAPLESWCLHGFLTGRRGSLRSGAHQP